MPRDMGDLVHRTLERLRVGLRRMRRAADLAHVLQRGRMHFVVGSGGLEVMQDLNVSAHAFRVITHPAAIKTRA